MLALDHAQTNAAAACLAPYARRLFDIAAAHASRLHADAVYLEHFLHVMLRDEESGASCLVLGAFADPQTLADEILALSPGILIVGSGRSLPFSPGSVLALEAARQAAVSAGAAKITPARLLEAAREFLIPAGRKALGELAGIDDQAGDGPPMKADVGVIAALTSNSRRALGAACKRAARQEMDSITPAHLALATVDVSSEDDLRRTSLDFALASYLEDPAPLPDRPLTIDAEFGFLMAQLGNGVETIDVLRQVLSRPTAELSLLFIQERITPALVERVGTAYEDPET